LEWELGEGCKAQCYLSFLLPHGHFPLDTIIFHVPTPHSHSKIYTLIHFYLLLRSPWRWRLYCLLKYWNTLYDKAKCKKLMCLYTYYNFDATSLYVVKHRICTHMMTAVL
jgi:hypothetical protein